MPITNMSTDTGISMRFIVSNLARSTTRDRHPEYTPGLAPESVREHHYQAWLYEVNRKSGVVRIIHGRKPIEPTRNERMSNITLSDQQAQVMAPKAIASADKGFASIPPQAAYRSRRKSQEAQRSPPVHKS